MAERTVVRGDACHSAGGRRGQRCHGDETPQGLVVHLVIETEGGLRYIDVWDSEADWMAFRDERLSPVVREVLASFGIGVDPAHAERQPIEVTHAWLPSRLRRCVAPAHPLARY